MPELYQFHRKILALPVIAVMALTAILVYNHFVALRNRQEVDVARKVDYPLLEQAQVLQGLLKQVQQIFIDNAVTGHFVEFQRGDQLATRFLDTLKNMETHYAEQAGLNIPLLRTTFSEFYGLGRKGIPLLTQNRDIAGEALSEGVQMDKRLAVIQGHLADLQRRIYVTFSTSLAQAERASQQALWVGVAAFVILVILVGVFIFLIQRLSKGLRNNLEDLRALNDRLEEMVQGRTEELQSKNRELEAFLYTVSHDLKAPVVSLYGMANALREDYENQLDKQGKHYLQRVIANASQMEALIQQLLELSKIGSVAYTPEVVDSETVVRGVFDQFESQVRDRGILVEVRSPLPRVYINRLRLHQIFSNLVGNAVKFIGETPKPFIEVGAEDKGDKIQFYVKDNGIGIDETYHEKIFGVFQRLQEVGTEGTGIGLAIVKRIVESNGGRIWLDSKKGEGSTFFFTANGQAHNTPLDVEEPQYATGKVN